MITNQIGLFSAITIINYIIVDNTLSYFLIGSSRSDTQSYFSCLLLFRWNYKEAGIKSRVEHETPVNLGVVSLTVNRRPLRWPLCRSHNGDFYQWCLTLFHFRWLQELKKAITMETWNSYSHVMKLPRQTWQQWVTQFNGPISGRVFEENISSFLDILSVLKISCSIKCFKNYFTIVF